MGGWVVGWEANDDSLLILYLLITPLDSRVCTSNILLIIKQLTFAAYLIIPGS